MRYPIAIGTFPTNPLPLDESSTGSASPRKRLRASLLEDFRKPLTVSVRSPGPKKKACTEAQAWKPDLGRTVGHLLLPDHLLQSNRANSCPGYFLDPAPLPER